MRMTANMFASIVASLRGDSGRRQGERRHDPRVGVSAKVTFIRVEGGKPTGVHEAVVRDLSRTGIGLRTNVRLKKGDTLIVRLPGEGREPLALVYTACHCHPLGPVGIHVGANLERIHTRGQTEPTYGPPVADVADVADVAAQA